MEKIKTIDDEFIAHDGLTQPDREPLLTIVKFRLDMARATPEISSDWQVQVGVYTGPVVAGIVGDLKYQFDV